MPLNRLPSLDKTQPIVDPKTGLPTPGFQRFWLNITVQAGEGAQAATDYGPLIAQKVSKGTSTGWSAPTGTFSKTTFPTYTAPTASVGYSQAQMQAVMDHVQTLSEHLASVIQASLTSELIGP